MRERRFHVESLEGDVVRLSKSEHHHLLRVLRLRVGDPVALFDGRGRAAAGRLSRLDDDAAEVEVGKPLPSRESSLRIRLAVVPPKGDRMTFIVQRATELGAAEIVPLTSARGEWDELALSGRLARWRTIALESCKQSGRSLVPGVTGAVAFSELAASRAAPLWIAQPGEPPPALGEGASAVTIGIGPEGGFSAEEIALARESGAVMFGLGPRTLRTETAALSSVTLFQWLAGDLKDRWA